VDPDELSAPLGQRKHKKGRTLPVLVGLLGLSSLVAVGWVLFADNPLGDKPVAAESTLPARQNDAEMANIKSVTNQNDFRPLTRATAFQQVPPPDAKIITIIDGTNGRQQDVIVRRPTPGLAPAR